MDKLGKGMVHVQGGPEQGPMRFHHALKMVLKLKLMKCLFLNFPFSIFGINALCSETTKSVPMNKMGVYCRCVYVSVYISMHHILLVLILLDEYTSQLLTRLKVSSTRLKVTRRY